LLGLASAWQKQVMKAVSRHIKNPYHLGCRPNSLFAMKVYVATKLNEKSTLGRICNLLNSCLRTMKDHKVAVSLVTLFLTLSHN
jgi:hypothetical protein